MQLMYIKKFKACSLPTWSPDHGVCTEIHLVIPDCMYQKFTLGHYQTANNSFYIVVGSLYLS